ncbi:hypothetical protein JY651_13510 [Pyxidicoccus parkwayensis]|uniref:Uncharacterized protein n=1 Tax=Pyxidicoccus parkwayensis TaxID=2813578 RepID=A0ABX7P5Z6_9BACT|nr:hypothetical protein [Pyxidicoccus parkwaysis]QSQ25877.1 hypothetical protein JY651_13510 [Pyxidicoccus parkwaysis]
MSKISRNPPPQSPPSVSEPKTSAPAKNTVPADVRTTNVSAPKPTDGFDTAPKRASRQTVALDTPTRQQVGGSGGATGVATVSGPGADGKMTVRVETNTQTLFPLGMQARGYIEIRVKPLDLGIAPEQLQTELARAMAEKTADDMSTYGADLAANGYKSLEEWARATGYYGSPSHIAWAEAASARTGGQIPAEYWMHFDPFGGTAGNGPHILPTGEYPGALSRIAMAHDTDWDLGRYFGAGPLASLQGQPHPENLGPVGLVPGQGVDTYSTGHADWDVTYGSEVILPGSPPPPQIA